MTTKLSPKDQGHVKATQAINDSLERLKPLGYVDLFLIHWPGASGLPVDSIENETLRMESWQVLADIVDQKDPKVRFIGVSNFEVKHLSDVFLKIHVPYINQIEIHPFFHNKSLIDFCQDKGIRVQAYSSFGRGTLLNIPQVIQVAKECGLKSTSQVLLRWAIQHGFLVIPKSINPERITVNADIFSFNLSEAQMDFLDNLEKGQKVCWNPSTVA